MECDLFSVLVQNASDPKFEDELVIIIFTYKVKEITLKQIHYILKAMFEACSFLFILSLRPEHCTGFLKCREKCAGLNVDIKVASEECRGGC